MSSAAAVEKSFRMGVIICNRQVPKRHSRVASMLANRRFRRVNRTVQRPFDYYN
jgi:hypothetical protein